MKAYETETTLPAECLPLHENTCSLLVTDLKSLIQQMLLIVEFV